MMLFTEVYCGVPIASTLILRHHFNLAVMKCVIKEYLKRQKREEIKQEERVRRGFLSAPNRAGFWVSARPSIQ